MASDRMQVKGRLGWVLPGSGPWRRGFLLSLLAGLVCLSIGLSVDTELLLHHARYLLLEGGLYTTRFEINPPMIFLLYTVPAFFLDTTGIPAGLALNLFVFFLSLASVLILRRDLLAQGNAGDIPDVWTAAAAFILFVLPCASETYSDRDHFFYILALPWIVQRLLGLEPGRLSSLVAGVGFCIRPQYALIFLALQLFAGCEEVSRVRRVFDQASCIVGAVVVVYLSSVVAFFPGYVFDLLPVLSVMYPSISVSFVEKLDGRGMEIALFCVAQALLIFHARSRRAPLMALGLACFGVYFFSGGWGYMLLHLTAAVAIQATFLFSRQEAGTTAGRKMSVLFLTCSMIAALSVFSFAGFAKAQKLRPSWEHAARDDLLSNALRRDLREAAGPAFILLSYNLWSTMLEDFSGPPRSVLALPSVWLPPWLAGDPRAGEIRQLMNRAMKQALRGPLPPVIVIESSFRLYGGAGTAPGMPPAVYFRDDPELAALLSGYRLARKIGDCGQPVRKPGYYLLGAPKAEVREVNCDFEVWKLTPT